MATEYASHNIRVNAVSPGPVITDLAATSLAHEAEFPPLGQCGVIPLYLIINIIIIYDIIIILPCTLHIQNAPLVPTSATPLLHGLHGT